MVISLQRYGTFSLKTVSKIFSATFFSSLSLYLPSTLVEMFLDSKIFIYQFILHGFSFDNVDIDDIYDSVRVHLKKVVYCVTRDAIIRTFLVIFDPVLYPLVNDIVFLVLTTGVDMIDINDLVWNTNDLSRNIGSFIKRR